MLQEDINTLQHENMGMQTAITIALEQKKAVPESAAANRLLEATAAAAKALLTIDNFDTAVSTALQIIGESLDCDRITVIENFENPSNLRLPHWRVLYEWTAFDSVSQISDPDVAQGTYAGIESWYERCSQGQSISYLLEEMPEPFRSGQVAIGVKALHGVPIFVENQYWGIVGFDDCRTAKRRNPAELAVLKTAATCIGSAIQRKRTEQASLQAEQARVAELATANVSLQQRDRLLSVVAQITKDLLKREDIDVAIPTALEAVGKLVNISRVVLIIERQDPSTRRLKHCVVYEWVAAGIADHDSVGMSVMDNDHFQVMIQPLYQGQSIWRVIEKLPVVTRRQFEKLEIKSTGVVPIFIEGSYIGCVGFDDCVTPRHWSQQEIDVLTAAAESIGAALHRKQLVECLIAERARAAEERAAELARANEALRGCVNRLADQPNCETFWEHILLEASAQINSYAAALFLYNESSNTRVMKRYVREGKVVSIATSPELAEFKKSIPGDIASFWEEALFRGEAVFFNLDDCDERVSPRINWHQNQGHRSIVRVPLILGDRPLGFIGFCFREPRTGLPENMELIMALAQQATLAIQLTNLAEQGRQAAILEERNRMAREIHDTLAQAFTGVIIQLGAASRIITDESADVQAHMNLARDLAREGLAEARRSVNALRPQILETSNLRKAFKRLAAQMSAAIDTQIICTVMGEVYPLSIDRENNLLRIGQEALTNAIKYAQASEIQIQLVYQPTQFILRVKDNGQGFEMDSLSMVQGFGLISMKERCDRIGAELIIQSLPEQGTEIMISITNS
ncbi:MULTISPECIES: GAF domain-containing protein [unclassified Nodularia (in: cyanobacteria)]|uniref:GAF domain-containing protein n=1 Tax=unclassified Nodularia (in: cyanobacteria) TaxID=2656917 RepID=UPI00187F0E0E|nr:MULTISPECIES: GAF domain-containing protein [unclassified Nodularia (in: cyanobacteria)]MBE9198864.1 GAF domain-containing sensor histidine kinase [Nodularia sp. LEGE 06071]MCC2695516.1 GAF domain-containing sensor histidine kinase [Nodularia sp. LEGE 04288]